MKTETYRRRRKVKIKGVLRLVLILVVLVFLVYQLIQWNLSSNNITYQLEYGNIAIEDTYNALIIRNEILLTSSYSGTVTQLVQDGDKVKHQQSILRVVGSASTDSEVIETKETLDQVNIEEVINEIEVVKTEIAEAIKRESFEEIALLKEQLKLKLDTYQIHLNAPEASEVSETVVGDGNIQIGEEKNIYATMPGIVTYYMDGYEDDLTYERIFNLQLDQINNLALEPKLIDSASVNPGDVLCKIVDDSSFFIILIDKVGALTQYTVGDEVKVETTRKVIDGVIEKRFSSGDQVAIAIKVEEYFEDFYKERFKNVKITQDSFNGLKIKASSIVEYDGEVGVLVVDKLKEVHFKPIKIIKSFGDELIVKENVYVDFIDGEQVTVDTISLYDQVIIDGKSYRPGDKLR
jgi:putative membrane fusion protein